MLVSNWTPRTHTIRSEPQEQRNPYRREEPMAKTLDAPKASVAAGTSVVNTNKRMTIQEEKALSSLVTIVRAVRDFQKSANFSDLQTYVNASFNRLSSAEFAVCGDIERSVKQFLAGCKNGKNDEICNNFCKILIKKKELLEVKNIKKMLRNADGLEQVKFYLGGKDEYELHTVLKAMLEDYKKNRTPENREKYNQILALYGKQIVQVPTIKTSLNDKKTTRIAFEGAFGFPSEEENAKGYGYSKAYNEFLTNNSPRHKTIISDKDFYSSDAIRSLAKSENLSQLLPQLKDQLQKQGVDGELLQKCNVNDMGRILFKGYSANRDREPNKNDLLALNTVNAECVEGIRQTFWKEFAKGSVVENGKIKNLNANMKEMFADMTARNVDPNYIADLFDGIVNNGTVTVQEAKNPEKYQQPTPTVTGHHKFYIQDSAAFTDVMKVDDLGNFTAYMEYGDEENYHDAQHIVDADLEGGISERLVDMYDGENNQNLVYSGGWKKNLYVKDNTSGEKRKTYNDIALVKQGGQRE